MISEAIQEALNKQLNAEFSTTYNYLAVSAKFRLKGLHGFAHWARVQANLEREHAMKFYNFICDRGGTVTLTQVAQPDVRWETPQEAFEIAYLHEIKATAQIYRLVDMCIERRDHATNTFLQWFVEEQVKEEAMTNEIVQKLKLVGNEGNALFLIDNELRKR